MKIIVFEDNQHSNFNPLIHTRLICQLKIGTTPIYKRIFDLYDDINVLDVIARKELKDIILENHDFNSDINFVDSEKYLFINSSTIIEEKIPLTTQESIAQEIIAVNNNKVSYAIINGNHLKNISTDDFLIEDLREIFDDIDIVDTNILTLEYYWDLIKYNPKFIVKDFEKRYKKLDNHQTDYIFTVTDKNRLFIGESCQIDYNCYFDTTDGPIIIEDNVKIGAFSWIKGPVFIGEKTEVKPHSQISGGSSIHYNCRVGGEVNNAIFHSFSNKGHHGFVGHSYVGKWVNFGAGTTNSNLKNNYGKINVYMDGENSYKTDMQYLGMAIGDYTKFSINCSINSGSIFGFSSNIFSSGELLPKFTGDFRWGKDAKFDIDKALDCAAKMMDRRDQKLSKNEIKRFKEIYENC